MDKLTIVLVIARNGLTSASGILKAKAAALDPTAPKYAKEKSKLEKLAKVLDAADKGLSEYLGF
jgi:hypothetical protein